MRSFDDLDADDVLDDRVGQDLLGHRAGGRENSLVVVLPNDRVADRFEWVLRAAGTQIQGPDKGPDKAPETPQGGEASPEETTAGAGAAAPAAAVSGRAEDETGPEPARVEQDVKA